MNLNLTPARRRLAAGAIACATAFGSPAVTAPAQAATGATGVAVGYVSFGGAGLPPASAPCGPTSFILGGTATGVALHTALSGFAGTVWLWGSGGSQCENAAIGNGGVSIAAEGVGPTGSTLSCPSLHGIYHRVGGEVALLLVGECWVNGVRSGNVTFAAHATFTADDKTQGGVTPVTNATFVAEFSIIPV